MNRFLLTLLALMTGLVAQVAPAQAVLRDGGETEIGSIQVSRSAVRLARQVATVAARSGVSHDAGCNEAVLLPRLGLVFTTVRIGIDRARE